MEGKHTRGTWEMCGEERDGCVCGQIWESGSGDHRKAIATCHGPHWSAKADDVPSPDEEEQKANMRLISSAPDLLEACERALAHLMVLYSNHDEFYYLRDAIAKAKGEA